MGLNISETRPDSRMVSTYSESELAYVLLIAHAPDDITWPDDVIMVMSCFLCRPYAVTGGLLFHPWCFFLVFRHVFSKFPRPIAPPDRNLRVFYNASPKIRGALPQKYLGAKNMQNFRRFWTTSDFDREYLRNGPTYPKSEYVTYYGNSSCVWWKKSGELGPITAWNYMWVWSH